MKILKILNINFKFINNLYIINKQLKNYNNKLKINNNNNNILYLKKILSKKTLIFLWRLDYITSFNYKFFYLIKNLKKLTKYNNITYIKLDDNKIFNIILIYYKNKYFSINFTDIKYLYYFKKIIKIQYSQMFSTIRPLYDKINEKYNISNYNISLLFFNYLVKKKNMLNNLFTDNKNKQLIFFLSFYYKSKYMKARIFILDLLLKKYLENYINSKIILNFNKYKIKLLKKKNKSYRFIKNRIKRIRRLLKFSQVSTKTFLYMMIVFLYSKDINLIYKLLIMVLQNMHFKNHKRFLYYLKVFITKTLYRYYHLVKFAGFYFFISGKISCSGNSKTRRYSIKYGKHSFSNKMLKIKNKKGLIHTKTGVLGFKLVISYL